MLTNSAPSTQQRQPSTFRIRQSMRMPDDGRRRSFREQIATLEEALREAWRVFDRSAHTSLTTMTCRAERACFFVGGVQGPHGDAQGSAGRRMRHPATMPGAGDECTWPAFAMLPCDPRVASNVR